MTDLRIRTVVLGAGPAGTGPLVCAISKNRHQELLDGGVAWMDRSESMGKGSIGNYDITSDTASSVLLECLAKQEDGPLKEMLTHPMADEVRKYGSGPLPLTVCGRYFAALGGVLRKVVEKHKSSQFLAETTASEIDHRDDVFHVSAKNKRGDAVVVAADRVVFAMGGRQIKSEILDADVASGVKLRGAYEDKTMFTSDLVTSAGQAELARRLAAKPNPRVVILGSSHSAFTAAWILLGRSGATFDEGAITILCRRKPKVFYPTPDHARADGYTEWSERDVCPVTGRVFRLAGLRLAARDLMRSISGLGDIAREHRVKLETFAPSSSQARVKELLDSATVIVPAFGYAPITIPVSKNGQKIGLLSDTKYRAPLVDGACRVLATDRTPIKNMFAMGLASGFVPHGELGGEPSFDGQTNGLWLYQNGVGEIVLDQILAS